MNALEAELIERIERDGPITFCEFMEAALYHPRHGYYNTPRQKIGPGGDYYTSSNVHSAFGAILARAFAGLWEKEESDLTILEIGAGAGLLAQDIINAFQRNHPAVDRRLRYLIAERSEAMRRLQTENLAPCLERVAWVGISEIREPISGIVFSNELFDSLPVHRIRRTVPGWEEQYVGVAGSSGPQNPGDDRRLNFEWRELSDDEIAVHPKASAIAMGQVVEVNLNARDLLKDLSGILASGSLVTIDYGDLERQVYAPVRRDGTLRCFDRHRVNTSPLDRVGEQDITTSVNFTALMDWGRELGFEVASYETQRSFLLRMGLAEMAAASDSLRDRLALKNLFVPGGIGETFRVLIQKRVRS